MTAIDEGNVLAGKQKVHYYQAGEQGSPVVLLHGGGIDSAMVSWRLAIPALAQEHRVYAPDWPGYGQSPGVEGEYSLALLVETLAGLLDAWNLQKASLVGISMGAGAALGFALDHPERVQKLVLVDSYGLQSKAPFHKLSYLLIKIPLVNRLSWALLRASRGMTRWTLSYIMNNPQAITPELVDEVYAILRQPGVEKAFTAFQQHEITWQGLRSSFMERLPGLQVETLLIHGAQDLLVPLSDARRAAEILPNARLEVIAKAGHWSPRDQPESFNRLAAEFLADG